MSTLAALPFGRTRSMKTPVVVRRMRAPNGQTGLGVNVANALPMRRAVDFSGPVAIAIPTLVRDIAAIAVHLTNGAGWRGADKSVDVFLGDWHKAAEPERTAGC